MEYDKAMAIHSVKLICVLCLFQNWHKMKEFKNTKAKCAHNVKQIDTGKTSDS